MTSIPFNAELLRGYCLAKTANLLSGRHAFGLLTPKIQSVTYGEYTYLDMGADILAVAHCDTVPHQPSFGKARLDGMQVYFSTALDDRLGVYTLLEVLPQLGIKYDVLLSNNEEKGLSTAELFTNPMGKQYKWIFEFDRRGVGAVYYQYDNTAIRTAGDVYFKHEFGSFSDISLLGGLGCAGINVATGYYSEHTYYCHMVLEDWKAQVERFYRFYQANKDKHFPYAGTNGRRYSYYGGTASTYGGAYSGQEYYGEGAYYPAKKHHDPTMPANVFDWCKSQAKIPYFRGYDEMRKFRDTMIPILVDDWIQEEWLADRNPQHPSNQVEWWNWWMAVNIETAKKAAETGQPEENKSIVPFEGNSSAREREEEEAADPDKLSADELLEQFNKYVEEREKYQVPEHLKGIGCDNCERVEAEFFIQGIYTCRDCDDMLWVSEHMTPGAQARYLDGGG